MKGLLALGQGGHREASCQTVAVEHPLDGREVGLAAVEQQHVWPAFLALEPALDDFDHHSQVVGCVGLDSIGPVLLLGRAALAQHHRGADPLFALQLSHVEADDVVEGVQSEHPGSVVSGSLLEAAGAPFLVAHDLDVGVLVSHPAQPRQLAALRHSDLDRAAAPLCEPVTHRLADGGRDQHDARWAGARVVLGQYASHRFGDVATVDQRVLHLALYDPVFGIQYYHDAGVAAGGEADSVAVLVEPAVDDLLRDGPLDRAYQVSRLGGVLVVEAIRGLVHISLQGLDENPGIPVQHTHGSLHLGVVAGGVDARRVA